MINPNVTNILEQIVDNYPDQYENGELLEALKNCTALRFRDLINDTVAEFNRMTNFSRIFPARNSKLYDKYFSGNKSLTKIMYKALHSAEIVPYGIRANQPAPHSVAHQTSNLTATTTSNPSGFAAGAAA